MSSAAAAKPPVLLKGTVCASCRDRLATTFVSVTRRDGRRSGTWRRQACIDAMRPATTTKVRG
jgi:hypothetical protein